MAVVVVVVVMWWCASPSPSAGSGAAVCGLPVMSSLFTSSTLSCSAAATSEAIHHTRWCERSGKLPPNLSSASFSAVPLSWYVWGAWA